MTCLSIKTLVVLETISGPPSVMRPCGNCLNYNFLFNEPLDAVDRVLQKGLGKCLYGRILDFGDDFLSTINVCGDFTPQFGILRL